MDIEDIVDLILIDVPDCPLITVRQGIKQAAREFCTRADAWVERDRHVVVHTLEKTGQVVAPAYGEPIRLTKLTLGGRDTLQGKDWKQVDPVTVEFARKPSESIIKGDLAMRPHYDEMPPDEVVDRWGEAFADGARSSILMKPQKWRDLDLAQYYQRRFDAYITEAKSLSRFGHGRGNARVQNRRFI